MELTEKEKKLIIVGYINGYEAAHNDTVEGNYCDSEEKANDWLVDATSDNALEYDIEHLQKT